jgi:hypothetical protein
MLKGQSDRGTGRHHVFRFYCVGNFFLALFLVYIYSFTLYISFQSMNLASLCQILSFLFAESFISLWTQFCLKKFQLYRMNLLV